MLSIISRKHLIITIYRNFVLIKQEFIFIKKHFRLIKIKNEMKPT